MNKFEQHLINSGFYKSRHIHPEYDGGIFITNNKLNYTDRDYEKL